MAGISIYQGYFEKRIVLFDLLESRRSEIESGFGSTLEWNRAEEQQTSSLAVYRDGSVESSDSELKDIREWHITNLLKLKEVFQPEIEQALKTLT